MPPLYANIAECRSCGEKELSVFLQLGQLPLSGHLLRVDQLDTVEPRYPMDIAFCHACGLVQLLYTVDPTEVFATDYPYFSSVSPTWVAHCQRNVDALVKRFTLGVNHLAVEIASNDGYLLQHFLPHGIDVLGIDPAEGPAKAAEGRGIPTRIEFFTEALAQRLVAEGTHADVILGNNVLAHVLDQNDFVAGVATLLTDDGVAVFEFPHLLKLIERCEFDTMYHEHLCYFSIHAVAGLFRRHGLAVWDVEELPTHGGSLRIYVRKDPQRCLIPLPAVGRVADAETLAGLMRIDAYASFAKRVARVQGMLREFLTHERAQGRTVVAYGAAAKGGTLLNSSGIAWPLLSYVVDKSPAKQGRYMTGSRLPVHPPEKLLEDQPDYALLLTWNFKDEILEQQAEYRRRGGKFVLPIPELEIV